MVCNRTLVLNLKVYHFIFKVQKILSTKMNFFILHFEITKSFPKLNYVIKGLFGSFFVLFSYFLIFLNAKIERERNYNLFLLNKSKGLKKKVYFFIPFPFSKISNIFFSSFFTKYKNHKISKKKFISLYFFNFVSVEYKKNSTCL